MTDLVGGRLVLPARLATGLAGRAAATPQPAVAWVDRAPRRRLPVRMLIVAWVLALTATVLVVVNVASRQTLLAEVDERVTETLAREAAEFTLFASAGVDQAGGQPLRDVQALLETHLSRQSPDDDEILFGFVDPAPGAAAPGVAIRQADEPPYDVSADRARSRMILDAPATSGSLATPHGELRWEKRRAVMSAGSGGWFVAGYFVDRDRIEIFDTMRTLVLFSVLGLVLAGFGAWLMAGRILAPVRLVRSVAAEISQHDLSRRIALHGRDEMAALAQQFNEMLDRLQGALVDQNRFIDAASHELRTPLTIVRGNLELLGDDPDERVEVVRLATDELDRMTRIVDDLLVLSRSQRPDFLRLQLVSVADLTRDARDAAAGLSDRRRWVVEDVGRLRAELDPHRLHAALLHLARNAEQHTVDGDEIRLGSSVNGEVVRFWVTDRGVGVPHDQHTSIFERFARGGGGGPRAAGTGAGLGLAVVRAVAQAHGGTATTRSNPDAGATFVVELPLR